MRREARGDEQARGQRPEATGQGRQGADCAPFNWRSGAGARPSRFDSEDEGDRIRVRRASARAPLAPIRRASSTSAGASFVQRFSSGRGTAPAGRRRTGAFPAASGLGGLGSLGRRLRRRCDWRRGLDAELCAECAVLHSLCGAPFAADVSQGSLTISSRHGKPPARTLAVSPPIGVALSAISAIRRSSGIARCRSPRS
jgi:hypothetical protein